MRSPHVSRPFLPSQLTLIAEFAAPARSTAAPEVASPADRLAAALEAGAGLARVRAERGLLLGLLAGAGAGAARAVPRAARLHVPPPRGLPEVAQTAVHVQLLQTA